MKELEASTNNNLFKRLLFPNDDKKNHFKSLDGLRGIAVFIVLLSHSSNASMYLFPGLNFIASGKIGVFLFFVLSAYLLDRQIILGFVNNKVSFRFWANYFLRRFLRIFPLYAIALFTFYVCYKNYTPLPDWPLILKNPISSLSVIWRHLTLQEGKLIFWSIGVEFKYYFLSPLIMAFCNYVLKWNLKK